MLYTYQGVSIETGGTAITGNAAPAIRHLRDEFLGKTVLGLGTGRGRNALYLRDHGVQCFSYDPFHGTDTCGFSGTSNTLPSDFDFDIAFTCYVLNVLPRFKATELIEITNKYAETTFHVTRSRDVVYLARKYLDRRDPTIMAWCADHDLPTDDPEVLATFGYPTSRGFQRLVLDVPGHETVASKSGWNLWKNIS